MKKALICAALLAGTFLAACCQAPPARETPPPPPAKPGATLRKKLNNHPSRPKEPTLAEKINRLILPEEPEVSGKTLEEAIDMLRVRAYDADNVSSTCGWPRGVNLVLISGGEITLPSVISLKLKDVPFAEALRYVTGLAGMKYRVDKHAVVVTPEDSEPPPAPPTEADASTEREKRLLYSLSHRITPTINLHDCLVDEAVEFLRVDNACYDEAPPASLSAPRNIVLHVRDNPNRRRITLDLHNISLLEALGYMAEMTGLKLSLRSSALVFSDHDLGSSPLTAMQRTPLGARTSRINLPKLYLQETSLEESLEFLHAKVRELDAQKQDVNILVRPGGATTVPYLDLKGVSLLDALDHIAIQSDHHLSSEGDSFVLRPAIQQ